MLDFETTSKVQLLLHIYVILPNRRFLSFAFYLAFEGYHYPVFLHNSTVISVTRLSLEEDAKKNRLKNKKQNPKSIRTECLPRIVIKILS